MYLHEHDNWTRFTWDDRAVAPLLSGVRFLQGRLLGRVSGLGFSLDAAIELDAVSGEVVASSRIEGVNLDAAKVRSSVARRLDLGSDGVPRDTRSVDGAVSILVDATQNCRDPLTFDRLASWHGALFPEGRSGLRKISVARYRTGPICVASGPIGRERIHFQAPDPSLVPGLMDEFLQWIDSDGCEGLISAAIAHLWFLTIHPFDDGNGRIARTITEMLLARSDGSPRRFYSMARHILDHRSEYYERLERSQKASPDVTEWVLWFLGALKESLVSSDERIGAVLRRDGWWRSVDGIELNDRQRRMLQRLLDGFEGKLTTSKWAKMCKVSQDSALRDINDLIEKGVLVRDAAAGGRSTSYLLAAEE
ncbi:Fic family protein [Xiamenia xianingshaonis]|uniref:DUF4172 domain-containing protein n=1 Tax=Xiamenia xianingshaonis TaxID=2682776 RepID=A0A9E6SUB2_9ACTN|nr:Fic family protein [Xiamenia xianingshaonis]NHM14945.1 DUF4172 domain-containing protein [Xiamenia xianingshaonis]QTU84249.1 Fic family protein [Xiamenia xianingshaonis]